MNTTSFSYIPDFYGWLRLFDRSGGLPWALRKRMYQEIIDLRSQKSLPEILGDLRNSLIRVGRRADAGSVHAIYRRLVEGLPLSKTMGALPAAERAMLVTGEKGDLEAALRQILTIRARVRRMVLVLITYSTLPVGYAVLFYVFAYGIGAYLLPPLLQALPVEHWTGASYYLYLMGSFATGPIGPATCAAFVLLVVLLWRLMPRWSGQRRFPCDRWVFPFPLYRDFQGAIWLLNFVMLTGAGVSQEAALAEQIRHASRWHASYLRPLHRRVVEGVKLGVALRQVGHGFPSPRLIEQISTYEGSDRFESAMSEMAIAHADRVELSVRVMCMTASAIGIGLSMGMVLLTQASMDSLTANLISAVGR